MLTIQVTLSDGFDESTGKFVALESVALEFEHSLAALSKWESKWEKPFLVNDDKTPEEIISYFECMCLIEDFAPEVLLKLEPEQIQEILDYMNTKNSATTFNGVEKPPRVSEITTSELFYYWMTALGIDWQAQYWHLNRLINLIRVCDLKNKPQNEQRPVTRDDLAARRDLNEQRRRELGTSG
jgi:hypothetical protein